MKKNISKKSRIITGLFQVFFIASLFLGLSFATDSHVAYAGCYVDYVDVNGVTRQNWDPACGGTGGGSTTTSGGCPSGITSITSLINYVGCILKSLIPLLIVIAMIFFIWGVIQYFLNPENEEKRSQGKTFIMWGIIALFVITSMWGLVGILSNTVSGGDNVFLPQLPQAK